MAYQLIYTSSPISLTVGRSGFSTVARSKNMPEKLASLVEKCSVFDSHKNVKKLYSFRVIDFNLKNWYVLSRICEAGVDYTNRNNYLAHHLVLSAEEVQSMDTNPADILLGFEDWLDVWNKEPAFLDDVDLSKIKPQLSLPAKTWESVFSDAGYAVVLHSRNISINYEGFGVEFLLKLFCESLRCFIKPIEAWQTNFTTFQFDSDFNFQWRGVESHADINLSKKIIPSLVESKLSTYARTAYLNNTDRLNLKVEKPNLNVRRFDVVETKKDFSLTTIQKILIGSISILLLLLALMIWLLNN